MLKWRFGSSSDSELNLDLLNCMETIIQSINSDQKNVDQTFNVVAISAFTKTDFNLIDKRFKEFGENYQKYIKIERLKKSNLINLVNDSFCDLVLSNVGFSNSVLFPKVDIQHISLKLQVKMLMNGMYFNLLPQIQATLNDVKFHFQ
jgi:hypothetical protein